ncbi:MAG TPA: hypothetical protein VLK35_07425 [Methylomirabilota bacterium]|nr:hypothetical protein [Methylomirabilota bacterium]
MNRHTAEGFGQSTGAAKDFLAELREARYRFFAVRDTGSLTRLDPPFLGGNVLAIPEAKLGAFPELEQTPRPGHRC